MHGTNGQKYIFLLYIFLVLSLPDGIKNMTCLYKMSTKNYYDLVKDKNVFLRQIQMAKEYGVDAFCYYHYWFANGKKLMEKPIERMLSDKSLDMPFCLCWANENWSRRWDGSETSILMAQDYGDKQGWQDHFEYLLNFFNDERYLKDEQGRPIRIL